MSTAVGRVPDRAFLLRAVVTLAVLVAVAAARHLLGVPPGFAADVAALYLAVLLGGLFTLPEAGAHALDDPAAVAAFLLAPLGAVAAVIVLALALSVGALSLQVGITLLAAAVLLLLALLAATALVPAATWSEPPERNTLARVANGAADLAGTLFRPGAVAAAVFLLVARLL